MQDLGFRMWTEDTADRSSIPNTVLLNNFSNYL